LYFTSDRPGGYGGTDIYYTEIHERGGIIGAAINAGPVVNTEGNEMFPFINAENKLFFSSDGHVGFGQMDVYSTISNEEGEITDVINLGFPLNSSADDFGFFVHKDGITGYLSSNREGGIGGDDIYKFKFTPALAIEGIIIDGINDKPIDGVSVKLFDQKTKTMVMETISDENGYYRMPMSRKTNYRVEASRRTHPTEIQYFNTFSTKRSTKMIRRDIVLNPVLDLKLLADLNRIYFDFNKSNIRPDAAKELDKVVKVMTEVYPDMIIKSTYEYLISNGVSPSQILSYDGFGKQRPVNNCKSLKDCSSKQLGLNRRTEFPIIQIKKGIMVSK